MQVVGLVGAKQSGKSTAAGLLVTEYGFIRVAFADPLKNMLKAIGVTHAQLYGNDKEVPSPLLSGRTGRYAMQGVGDEFGRKWMGEDFWVNLLRETIFGMGTNNVRIVVEDVRRPNELAMLRGIGAELWVVRRPCVEPNVSRATRWLAQRGLSRRLHASEAYWQDFAVDWTIHNTRTQALFEQDVRNAAWGLLCPTP